MERDTENGVDEVALIQALSNMVRRNPRVRDSLRVLATEFLTFLNDAEQPTVAPMQAAAAAAAPVAAPVVLAPVALAPTVQLPRETVQLQMGGEIVNVQALS